MVSSSQGVLPLPAEARRAIRWLCTNNPFYVISAGLFLAGLWLSFGDPMLIENTWAMMAGLGGYTLLLAGTAYVLVRYLNLWDDARTVLLLVVLMFLATSVTFDEVLVVEVVDPQGGLPIRGMVSYVAGLVFAVAVSAGLLRGIGLTLPAGFRLPYYLMLGLFFLYPLILSPLLVNPHGEALQWGLFGFSTIAGLIFLTLLPAIRRGPKYVRGNGSPWPWPMYPWSLFVFLALAVPARALLLCWSLHPVAVGAGINHLIFGFYFLVPFGLALCVLVLEMGLRSRNRGLIAVAMATPMVLVVFSVLGHRGDPVYQEFLRMFTARLGGDPLVCTLIACAVFYGYSAIRRVESAVEALAVTLVVIALRKLDPQPMPLVVAGTLLLGLGILRRQSWRCMLGALGLVTGMVLAFPIDGELTPYRWPIAFHLVILICMIVGAAFEDDFARAIRFAGPFLALLACLWVMLLPFLVPASIPRWLLAVYPPLMAGLLAGFGIWRWNPPTLVIAGLIFVGWSLLTGWQVYRVCRQLVVGLDYLVLSLVVFVLAILVSLVKSGLLLRWLAARGQEPTDLLE